MHPQPLIHDEYIRQRGLLHIPEKPVSVGEASARGAAGCQALASKNAIEVDLSARCWHILEDIAQRQPDGGPELEQIFAPGVGEGLEELELLGDLKLGKKVRRADEAVEAGEGGAGDASSH